MSLADGVQPRLVVAAIAAALGVVIGSGNTPRAAADGAGQGAAGLAGAPGPAAAPGHAEALGQTDAAGPTRPDPSREVSPDASGAPDRAPAPTPTVYRWETFTEADGLPSHKGLAVAVDGDRVWIGTDKGLVRLEDGKLETFTTDDGLAHDVVINLKVDEATGDLWIATVAGLTRYSAGKFRTFTQLDSGLQNDMVYCVEVDGPHVWAATAAGISRYDTRTDQWDIWNETNAPMHEPWTYGVTAGPEHVFVGAWGGGLLEYDKTAGRWKDYVDPDHEMELDVFPDDGIVHDIVSFVDYEDGRVWVATYFGLSVFDGTRWKGYFEENSGLVGNFINVVRARGAVGWMGTDRGISSFDGALWRTYTRADDGTGLVVISDAEGTVLERIATPTAPAHNYVLGIDFQGEDIWISTEDGISRGTPDPAEDEQHDVVTVT
jgi:ligand-binding sensor domain-containing protein